ncbi:MAG: hypothetical protein JWM16_4149 [Verrucomicrobiales bacterium]|nr:hypothetical protein [Verrucomicrobiales bacterium]
MLATEIRYITRRLPFHFNRSPFPFPDLRQGCELRLKLLFVLSAHIFLHWA